MSQQIQISQEKLKEIIKEYDFNTKDIFSDYTDEQVSYFEAVKKLPLPDYIILLLYAHFQSQRKVGKIIGVSHSVVGREIRRIRQDLQQLM